MPLIATATSSPSGSIDFDWVDPFGVSHSLLNNASVNVEVGERGLGLPPVTLMEEKLPSASGTVVRHAQIGSREIELPLVIEASSGANLQVQMDAIYDWFATADERNRSPGYLQVTRRDGTTRQIACYYVGGLEGDLSDQEAGETWQTVVLQLKAADPYPTDLAETEVAYTNSILGVTQAIINTGGLDANPVITVSGPASAITITSLTTGKKIELTANGGLALLAGDTLTIDTRPASQRTGPAVTDDEGTNFFSRLSADSSLDSFVLLPGSNQFVITASGTTGGTAFGLSWLPRYRGVLR